MAAGADIPAWIALFVGLYALAAAVGELRAPNTWWMMLKEFERSPVLRFVTGLVTLALGAARIRRPSATASSPSGAC